MQSRDVFTTLSNIYDEDFVGKVRTGFNGFQIAPSKIFDRVINTPLQKNTLKLLELLQTDVSLIYCESKRKIRI